MGGSAYPCGLLPISVFSRAWRSMLQLGNDHVRWLRPLRWSLRLPDLCRARHEPVLLPPSRGEARQEATATTGAPLAASLSPPCCPRARVAVAVVQAVVEASARGATPPAPTGCRSWTGCWRRGRWPALLGDYHGQACTCLFAAEKVNPFCSFSLKSSISIRMLRSMRCGHQFPRCSSVVACLPLKVPLKEQFSWYSPFT